MWTKKVIPFAILLIVLAGAIAAQVNNPTIGLPVGLSWAANIFAIGGGETKSGQNAIVAASGAINNTETIIVRSVATMPANRLVAGTVIRATWTGTCTSSAANTSTFAIRYGTAGTTSDGLLATATTAAAATSGTSIAFRAVMEVTLYTVGATTTGNGTLTVYNQGSTGIATTAIQVIPLTMTSINTTTANTYLDATYVSAATTTTSTFQQGVIEFPYE